MALVKKLKPITNERMKTINIEDLGRNQILFFVAFLVIFFFGVVVIESIFDNAIVIERTGQSHSNIILTELTQGLTPIGSGITSSEVKANNLSWLEFDGVNDYVQVALGATNGTNQSFSYWIRPEGTCSSGGSISIFGKNFVYWLKSDSSCLLDIITRNSSSIDRSLANFTSINHTNWMHIVYLINNNTNNHSVYVNGTLASIGALEGVADVGNDLRMGGNVNGAYFPGAMDEIRIYNQTLSNESITAIYNSGRAANSSLPSDGLIVWYSFNEGSGSTVHDLSGNNNNGE